MIQYQQQLSQQNDTIQQINTKLNNNHRRGGDKLDYLLSQFSKIFDQSKNNNNINGLIDNDVEYSNDQEIIEVEDNNYDDTNTNASINTTMLTTTPQTSNDYILDRYVFPTQRQFVFNGVNFYNLGGHINAREFSEQFITSDHFQIRQIQKTKVCLSVEFFKGFYHQSDKQIEEFKFNQAIHLLENSQDLQSHQQALIIQNLKQYSLEYKRHIDIVNVFYNNKNEQDSSNKNKKTQIQEFPRQIQLNNIKQQRIQQMQKLCKSLKEQLFKPPYNYIISMYFTPEFDKQIQQIDSYDVQLPFVELLGVDEDIFINMTMRNGFQCWLGENSCTEFQNTMTNCLIQKDDIQDITLYNQELVTFDGIQVYSDLRIIFVQNMWDITHPFLPVGCSLHPSLDSFIILSYNIQDKHIKEIQNIRNQSNTFNDDIQILTQSMPYTIQSEMFVNKFYNNNNNNNNNKNIDSSDQNNNSKDKDNMNDD